VLQELLDLLAVVGGARDAEGSGDGDLPSRVGEADLPDHPAKPLGALPCPLGVGHVEVEHKLLPSVPPRRVALADPLAEDRCHATQHLVAERVPVGVVDPLEVVDVQHHDAARVPTVDPREIHRQPFEERPSVRQPGQSVRGRLFRERLESLDVGKPELHDPCDVPRDLRVPFPEPFLLRVGADQGGPKPHPALHRKDQERPLPFPLPGFRKDTLTSRGTGGARKDALRTGADHPPDVTVPERFVLIRSRSAPLRRQRPGDAAFPRVLARFDQKDPVRVDLPVDLFRGLRVDHLPPRTHAAARLRIPSRPHLRHLPDHAVVPLPAEKVPVPPVQFPHPLDIAPYEMTRQFHRRDHGIPPWALLVADREEDAFHHPLPENRDGGDPGGGAPRTAFPRSVPPRIRPDLEKRFPENGRLPDGNIRVGKRDFPGDRRAAAQQEPLVENGSGRSGPGDVGDMGSADQPHQPIQRLPDPILQFLFPPEQAGFLRHLPGCGKTARSRILPRKNQRPAPGDCLPHAIHLSSALPISSADGDARCSRDQGHRGSVENLFFDRSWHRGQPYVGAQDRRDGERHGELQGDAEKQGRRDDAGPGDRRNVRVDLHDRGGSPGEGGEQVGDTVIPIPRKKVLHEEVRGRERTNRHGKEERNPSRDHLPKEKEGKEVRRRRQHRGVPGALQRVTAAKH
jgi:hypothetical protein